MREPLIHLHLAAEGLWGLGMGFSCPEQMSCGASALPLAGKVTFPPAPNLPQPCLCTDISAAFQTADVPQADRHIHTAHEGGVLAGGAGLPAAMPFLVFCFAGSQRDGFLATLKTTPARYPSAGSSCSGCLAPLITYREGPGALCRSPWCPFPK